MTSHDVHDAALNAVPSPREDGLSTMGPDAGETEGDPPLDNIVPTRGYQMPAMVGLGASAGGIQALVEFFTAMPPDNGMVFVVILHLSPTHESTLPELLARSTTMKVVAAQDGQRAEPNHVYVIPAAKYLTCADGILRLVDLESTRGRRNTVDIFFRSLADVHGPRAIAAVLSGGDGDGALGMKRIKERGGLTIAQDPSEAEHAGMPRSAIATGMVDWVLRVAEMPRRILEYLQNERRLELPSEDGLPLPAAPSMILDGESSLREVLVFLRTRTGRDFSCYKRATVLRRIARRMQVNSVETVPEYVVYLRTHPGESEALLQDLLISVTNFFRDRDAFEAIERLIPDLFAGRAHGDTVRIWVPACATGEEAYSFAILLLEHAETLDNPPTLQVFACDLNDEAIQAARGGHYQDPMTADVSEERLKRFFVREHNGYRVRRELREMVLFATHDLLKDAPFSRMDLVSCRNLLIYLDRDAQQRVIETFHFALKPGGKLFLGSSEAVDEASPLFRAVDKKHRVYVHIPSVRSGMPLQLGPSTLLRTIQAQEQLQASAPVVHGKGFVPEGAAGGRFGVARELDRPALAELHFKLIERYAPPSVLINADHEIVHLSEHAGRFLRFGGGAPSMNLLRVVDPVARADVRAALFRAEESGVEVRTPEISTEIEGVRWLVTVRVQPAPELGPGFALVVFEHRADDLDRPSPSEVLSPSPPESVMRYMERELEQVKGHLRSTVEQYEASTEELKASNEELQAMNEELRSATEELETSREELQSINEELSTVNQEMKGKMDELANANSDLQNLMASTSIATVFLDRQLTIMRYTPRAVGLFHLIPSDVGRPLADLKHNLDFSDLIPSAEVVLSSLVPVEREVSDGERWYLARLQPYRTLEDHIGGVVLTLVDVTDRNRAVEALRTSEERLRLLIDGAKDVSIFTLDRDGRVDGWGSGAQAVFGYSDEEIRGQDAEILFTPEDRATGAPARELKLARDDGRAKNERWHIRKDGSIFYVRAR